MFFEFILISNFRKNKIMEKILSNKNPLLVKDDVGKPKPCTVKLPESQHSYGKPDNKDQEGAGKLTSVWTVN